MKSLLDWFIKNPIAGNLLVFVIGIAGFTSLKVIDNEFLPPIEPLVVAVTVPYPGAGPLEVEEQICVKIEEAVSDVEGVKEVRSTASQGMGRVIVEAVHGWDLQRLINDVKNRVDGISTFPAEAERPIVKDFTIKSEVVTLVVYGGDDEAAIKELSLKLKDRVMQLPGVSQVDVKGIRDYLVSVEVSEDVLRSYNLNFQDIATAIRRSSLNLPAGQMRNPNGDIQIQVYGQNYRARDFQNVVVVKNLDGSQVTLGDLATIKDTFEDKNLLTEYDGKIAAKLVVNVGENPDTIGTAKAVKEFTETYPLPDGYQVDIWSDQAYYLKDRLSILSSNAIQGLILVFVLLLLFLRPSLALWVAAGLTVAVLGTITVMPIVGTSINVVSTFAFLLILGILVDDSIVVSENIYSHYERGAPGSVAASRGVSQVAQPVILGVITTILVFVPMLMIPSVVANMFQPIPVVAMAALTFSLVEALLILPSHLSHLRPETEDRSAISKKFAQIRGFFARWLNHFSCHYYQPLLDKSLKHGGATLATFFSALIICLSLLTGGWLKLNFMPDFEGESLVATATMQEGVGYARLLEVQDQMIAGLEKLKRDPKIVNHDGSPAIRDSFSSIDGSTVSIEVNLSNNDAREITSSRLESMWQQSMGEIQGVQSLVMVNSAFAGDKDISLRLSGPDVEVLRSAADDLKKALAQYAGVVGINDSLSSVRQEIRISLKPYAETLGLELDDVARQVRNAFYGAEAQRIPLLREDVRVMVRYPEDDRATIENLVNMRVKLADGTLVPFTEVADAEFIPGYTTINRFNRSRVVDVFADVVPGVANANEVVNDILRHAQPELLKKYPGVRFLLDGQQQDMRDMIAFLGVGLAFSVLAMYSLLAVQFRSYIQPLCILSAVPFGIAGAVIGHLLLGLSFSFPSGFGVLATAGVVVNSNLVLIDRINSLRDEGIELLEAVRQGARERLRPILLTSLTTFFGLMPILLEESPSAATLIPMAVSLSFGVVFATTITLLMVPAMYTALESMKERMGFAAKSSVEIQSGTGYM